MGLIPPEKIAEIRDRSDIVAVIGEFVPLRRAGTNHLGLCPFHAEKTPSFNVSAQKQFFYCFGCQKSGDVFRFLMELEGRSFAEVARDLARRAGVEIPESAEETPADRRRRAQAEDERSKLLRLHDIACAFYEGQLRRSERALAYLQERGIGEEIRASFRIGYAPDGWDVLLRHLEGRGVPFELYEKAGLGIRREGSRAPAPRAPATRQSHYDRFRDRVLFPLITPAGEVVAFGGRVLPGESADKEGAKYINSPESPLYKKGEQLYGLHAARDNIRKSKQVVLVEGNFDVLSLHQHGINNAVAPMGTALTATQVRLLKRLLGPDGHVVLMLDGDRAGRSATLKDIWLFTEANVEDVALLSGSEVDVRVAQLPDGEDPDTYVARDRPGFERRLKTAKPAVDYVLDEAIKLAEHDSVGEKAKVLMKVVPLLKATPNREVQAMYVDRLAHNLAIRQELVWQALQRDGQPRQGRPAQPNGAPAPQAPPRPAPQIKPLKLQPLESNLVALCGDHPQLLGSLSDELLDGIADQVLSEMLREGREMAQEGEVSTHQLIELSPPELRAAVAQAALSGLFARLPQPEVALQDIGRELRVRNLQRELKEIQELLRRAAADQDLERKQVLMKRLVELQQMPELRSRKRDPYTPSGLA